MNKLAAVIAVVFALTTEAAFAQEKPAAPAPPPSPSPSWSGFHVGLDGGYAWDPNIYTLTIPVFAGFDNQEISDFTGVYSGITHSQASALSATGVTHPNVGGFFGGGQVGYDHQFGTSFVGGVEADFQGAGIRGRGGFVGAASTSYIETDPDNSCSLASTGGAGCTDTFTSLVQNEKSINWIGTARVRFGYLATPTLLVYGTGGLAYGGVSAQTSISQSTGGHVTGFITPGGDGHISSTRAGWTIGGGLEWLFLPNWSVKVEGLYYDLGTVQFASGPLLNTFPTSEFFALPNASNILTSTTHTRFYGDMFRVGLNYHF